MGNPFNKCKEKFIPETNPKAQGRFLQEGLVLQLVAEDDSHQFEQDSPQFEEGSLLHVVSILCFEVAGLQFVAGSPYSDMDGCTLLLFVEELLGYIHQAHLDYIPKQREKCRLNYKKVNLFGLIRLFLTQYLT